jgi:tRNA pseudouridine65 synthase
MTAPPTPPLTLLWRDEHLVAVHKPAGWLVHRTGLDAGETRFVVQTLRDQLGGTRVHPVHRLDKGTCGVLLLALHAEAARALGEAFMAHRVRKRYLALVRGWAPPQAEVDHPLRPDDAPPDAPAQPARTVLRRLACFERAEAFEPRFAVTRASLVEAEPLTGRRHQIRRHLKHLAHPILGDATHGKGPLNRWWAAPGRIGRQRLWLHAQALDFTHPFSGAPVALHSGLVWDAAARRLCAPAEAPEDLGHWAALAGALGVAANEKS